MYMPTSHIATYTYVALCDHAGLDLHILQHATLKFFVHQVKLVTRDLFYWIVDIPVFTRYQKCLYIRTLLALVRSYCTYALKFQTLIATCMVIQT